MHRDGGSRSRVCPVAVVGSPYAIQLNGEGGCGPDASVPGSGLPYQFRVLSGSVPPGLSLDRDGRVHGTPTQAAPGPSGGAERRRPALGRVVQSSEVAARVRRHGRSASRNRGVGLRGTGQSRGGWGTDVVGWVRGSSAWTRPRSNDGGDHGHASDPRRLPTQAAGDGQPRRCSPGRVDDRRATEARVHDKTACSRESWSVVQGHHQGERKRFIFDIQCPFGPAPDRHAAQHEEWVLSGKPRKSGTYRVTIEAHDGLRRTVKQTYVLTVRPVGARQA